MKGSETFFWDDLLEYIDDGRVIPIVGQELLRMDHEGCNVPLYHILAGRLADRLGVSAEGFSEEDSLRGVICRHLERGGRREDIYPRIRAIVKETTFPIPDPLLQLAAIRHFKLFVSTTCDSLLERAINHERFSGEPRTDSIAYAPNHVADLPCEMRRLERPTVYHLLGKLSAAPEYVITEEDTLEFLYAMQTEKRRPELLFDELRQNHLLLIGNHFPDWLARFFIRLAKGGRLSGQRDSSEILADHTSRNDPNLVLFLQNFSYQTRVFAEGGAVEFVHELHRRYVERHPSAAKSISRHADIEMKSPAAGTAGAAPEMPNGAVFISYASQDLAAAERLSDALDAVGIEVWFDRHRLEVGDDYGHKIRRNIRNCSLFVPLVSVNTQERLEGYFRLEWKLATDRAMQIAETVPFILPTVIDSTPVGEAIVPPRFADLHWMRLPNGEPTPEFTTRLVKLVRDHRKRERGLV